MKTTQETKPKELINNSKIIVKRNEKGQLLPGEVLNPNGKPLGTKHLSTQLREMLFEKPEGSDNTHGTLLNKRVLKKAITDGDMRAIELVYDRVEGKLVETNQNINLNANINVDNADELRKMAESVGNNIENGFKEPN